MRPIASPLLTRSTARRRPARWSAFLKGGWPRAFPLVQVPNPPLAVALVATVVEQLAEGDLHDYAYAIASVGFAAWAYLELSAGANWFRRLLGAGALVWLVLRLA